MWKLFICNEEFSIITKNVTKTFIWPPLQHNNRGKHRKPWVRPGFVYTTILCVVYVLFTVPKQNDDLEYHDCLVKYVPYIAHVQRPHAFRKRAATAIAVTEFFSLSHLKCGMKFLINQKDIRANYLILYDHVTLTKGVLLSWRGLLYLVS